MSTATAFIPPGTPDSLTVANARAALEQGVAAIRAGQTVFDLAAVTHADSSAVALLLAWQRAARKAGTELAYINVPAGMTSLAALYGVDSLLGAAAPAPRHH